MSDLTTGQHLAELAQEKAPLRLLAITGEELVRLIGMGLGLLAACGGLSYWLIGQGVPPIVGRPPGR